ncbi:MAG: Gfo/Idh/MocA family oxidoreductase [Acidobacteria bacterium]|nr:Gfo/Idh/MocA family oxidoreductase [Acidobacteriota bacterium]
MTMVVQNFRRRPHVQALRLAVQTGGIGHVSQTTIEVRQQIRRTTIDGWRERMAEPYVLDFAIHHFDLIRYVLGDDPSSVIGRSFRPSWSWFDGNSAAAAVIEMRRGIRLCAQRIRLRRQRAPAARGQPERAQPQPVDRIRHQRVVARGHARLLRQRLGRLCCSIPQR